MIPMIYKHKIARELRSRTQIQMLGLVKLKYFALGDNDSWGDEKAA
jgi:hypothetical protein